MERDHFASLVSRALDNLPDEFLNLLDNVDVTVEDYPSSTQHRGKRRESILGLYEGIPQTERGTHYNLVLPDRITIFQKPIEAICRSDDQIIDQVEKTVRHEIAHHFGLSDAELDRIERRWKNRQ